MKKLPLVLALALFAASSSFSQPLNAEPRQGQDSRAAKTKKPSKEECDKYRMDEYGGLYYNNKRLSSDIDAFFLFVGVRFGCDDLKGRDEAFRKRTSDSLYWEQRVVEVGREQAYKENRDMRDRADKVGWKQAEKEYHEGVKKKRKTK